MYEKMKILTLFIAIGAVLVSGLVAIPMMEEADARSQTASDRNKGQQGDSSSTGKRQGDSGGSPDDGGGVE
jgi:hypothetical protein